MSPGSATEAAKLVVLDRDGVINEDREDFVRTADDWRALPGSLEAISAFTRAGWQVVVTTNQSGIARGYLSASDLEGIHHRMRAEVERAGGRIDAVFVCPHGPDDGCSCRKPEPGLLRQVEAHYGRSVAGTPVIGDSARDLEAARRAGARPILVLTGNGRMTAAGLSPGAEIYADLKSASSALLEEDRP